jgi:hypothetical protein
MLKMLVMLAAHILAHMASSLKFETLLADEPAEWLTARAEVRALRNSLYEPVPGKRKVANKTKRSLAVLITGLQKHLLVKTKLEHIVEPARDDGWEVDVFMEIVGLGAESNASWVPVKDSATEQDAEGSADELLTLFKQNLELRGARLVHGRVLQSDYNVIDDLKMAQDFKRMSQYNPYGKNRWGRTTRTAIFGQNVLKRLKGLQTLMNVASASNDYDAVLVTRDTDFWLHDLDLDFFAPEMGAVSTVFTKACLQWLGIHDKTFLFTGDASKEILSHVYDDFFKEEYHDLDYTRNAEQYWGAVVTNVHGVISTPIHPTNLPTTDAFWRLTNGVESMCVKGKYLCPELESENANALCDVEHEN